MSVDPLAAGGEVSRVESHYVSSSKQADFIPVIKGFCICFLQLVQPCIHWFFNYPFSRF